MSPKKQPENKARALVRRALELDRAPITRREILLTLAVTICLAGSPHAATDILALGTGTLAAIGTLARLAP